MFAKILLGMLGFVVIFKVMSTKPPDGTTGGLDPVPPPPDPALTEMEMMDQTMEAMKREEWAWKDFPT